jgi:DNA-binding GntR family transcriptional regulator
VTVSQISEQDFLEIAELRGLLEPHALRHSAPRLTPADLQHSEAILMKADQAVDPLDRANLHWEFHRSLYKRAERPRLLAQIGSLYHGINRYLLAAWASSGLSSDWVDSHLLIVARIRDGDIEEASRLIVDQTGASTRRVQAHLHRDRLSRDAR